MLHVLSEEHGYENSASRVTSAEGFGLHQNVALAPTEQSTPADQVFSPHGYSLGVSRDCTFSGRRVISAPNSATAKGCTSWYPPVASPLLPVIQPPTITASTSANPKKLIAVPVADTRPITKSFISHPVVSTVLRKHGSNSDWPTETSTSEILSPANSENVMCNNSSATCFGSEPLSVAIENIQETKRCKLGSPTLLLNADSPITLPDAKAIDEDRNTSVNSDLSKLLQQLNDLGKSKQHLKHFSVVSRSPSSKIICVLNACAVTEGLLSQSRLILQNLFPTQGPYSNSNVDTSRYTSFLSGSVAKCRSVTAQLWTSTEVDSPDCMVLDTGTCLYDVLFKLNMHDSKQESGATKVNSYDTCDYEFLRRLVSLLSEVIGISDVVVCIDSSYVLGKTIERCNENQLSGIFGKRCVRTVSSCISSEKKIFNRQINNNYAKHISPLLFRALRIILNFSQKYVLSKLEELNSLRQAQFANQNKVQTSSLKKLLGRSALVIFHAPFAGNQPNLFKTDASTANESTSFLPGLTVHAMVAPCILEQDELSKELKKTYNSGMLLENQDINPVTLLESTTFFDRIYYFGVGVKQPALSESLKLLHDFLLVIISEPFNSQEHAIVASRRIFRPELSCKLRRLQSSGIPRNGFTCKSGAPHTLKLRRLVQLCLSLHFMLMSAAVSATKSQQAKRDSKQVLHGSLLEELEKHFLCKSKCQACDVACGKVVNHEGEHVPVDSSGSELSKRHCKYKQYLDNRELVCRHCLECRGEFSKLEWTPIKGENFRTSLTNEGSQATVDERAQQSTAPSYHGAVLNNVTSAILSQYIVGYEVSSVQNSLLSLQAADMTLPYSDRIGRSDVGNNTSYIKEASTILNKMYSYALYGSSLLCPRCGPIFREKKTPFSLAKESPLDCSAVHTEVRHCWLYTPKLEKVNATNP